MANRKNTFLIKRSNVAGKAPAAGDLQLGELALNTADNILYASGTTANSILPIGWDRVARTGDTMTGSLFAPSISATTISATTYLNLPAFSGDYLPLSGGTVTGATRFTSGLTANTFSATTYLNLPTDIRVTGSTYSNNRFTYTNNTGGTFNVLFNTLTGLTVNGNVVVTGTTTVGGTNDGITKLYANSMSLSTAIKGIGTTLGVVGETSNGSGTGVFGQNTSSGYGVRGSSNGGVGVWGSTISNAYNQAGVWGSSIGDVNTNIGVYGSAGVGEGGTPTNIGGVFYADGQGLYNYSVQLQDGTEGINKVLVSQTIDGKANWSSTLSGLTSVNTTTISATTYYNLPSNTFTGGTVSGATRFTNGLSANTFSATTYLNLPTDIRVTGGTYTSGTATFTNNTGGTFTVTGFSTGTSSTDTYVTGSTYSNNTFTFTNNTGGTFNVLFNTVTGLTSSGTISSSILSATTYSNLPIDVTVTGGTYTSGTATFRNNTGGTFNVTGFNTGTTTGNGTANYLARWTGTTGLGNSQIRDDGTNIGIGSAPTTDAKLMMFTTNNLYGLWVRNASVTNSGIGIRAFSDSGWGSQTGLFSIGQGHPTTGTSIGVDGGATDGLLGIGVRGTVGPSEFGSMVTGIGGYFDGRGDGGYGYPTISYSVQLLDGTEGINKVLVSQTIDGKANWSSTLSGLTSVNAITVSATTLIGDGSQITNLPSTSSVPYGIISAIASGNYLI